MNCSVAPTATLAVAGVMAIEVSVLVTVSAAVPLMPLNFAVMVLAPAVTPVARPDVLIVAVAVLELLQVTDVLIFAVELSL
jgi:hypothetical protein